MRTCSRERQKKKLSESSVCPTGIPAKISSKLSGPSCPFFLIGHGIDSMKVPRRNSFPLDNGQGDSEQLN